MASVVGFGLEVRQAIGSWEEVPQGEGTNGARAVRPMSLHYSADQAAASGRAKRMVLDKFVTMCSRHQGVQDILQGRVVALPAGSLSWRDLADQSLVDPRREPSRSRERHKKDKKDKSKKERKVDKLKAHGGPEGQEAKDGEVLGLRLVFVRRRGGKVYWSAGLPRDNLIAKKISVLGGGSGEQLQASQGIT